MIKQRTIKKSIKTTGIGLHSGEKVYLTLKPAPVDHGIQFVRSDLRASLPIKVGVSPVTNTQLATSLANDSAKVSTVEHLMSAFAGLGIDNVLVEVSAVEIPIMDGSSAPFIYLIQSAGIAEQDKAKKFVVIKDTTMVTDGDKWAKFEPYNGYQLNFRIDFNHPVLNRTNPEYTLDFSAKTYIKEISRARTFGFMRDLDLLRENNLALGGSLDNAIVVDDYRILNEDGLRYQDEFVRHKILDAVGDLYQIGYPIIGRFSGFKAGHGLNNLLIRKLMETPSAYEIVTFEKDQEAPISYKAMAPAF